MAQPFERELASCLSEGAGPPRELEALLGHFLEPEDNSEQDGFLFRAMNAGTRRRMAILSAIFSRCEWQGECLIWQGPCSGKGRGGGYGRFCFEGITTSVHRAVYAAIFGPIPGKKQVDHRCNNRLCCNPFHLTHMTHKRNQKLRDKRKSQKI